jgi:hypothetical protein
LFVQKETNQRKRAPEMITSAFFCQNAFAVTLPKKAEVRTISGLPPHLLPGITVNN